MLGRQNRHRGTAYQATPLTWAEYFLREAKNKKQYVEIVAYLREKGGDEGALISLPN